MLTGQTAVQYRTAGTLMLTGQTASKPDKGVDWTDLSEDRDKWWAVVNTVMNLPVR
jgi:hypothetical protein